LRFTSGYGNQENVAYLCTGAANKCQLLPVW